MAPPGNEATGSSDSPDASGSTSTATADATSNNTIGDGDESTAGDTAESSGETGEQPGEPGDPVLLFTDLTSGPNVGWQGSSERGAAVTVSGRNFGATRGDGAITIGGVALDGDEDYLEWGGPGRRPGLQQITFLLPSRAPIGDVDITVTVGGATSAPLAFTVRHGRLLHVEMTGSAAGDGSWSAPWADVQQAVDSMMPGDIAYLGDGVSATQPTAVSAAVNLSSHGEPGRPMALVAYPGATTTIGTAQIDRGVFNWVADDGTYADYWTIAGLEITCAGTCINLGEGSRAVANRITAPQGDGQSGAIHASESAAAILGNELTDVGSADCSKLYHTIYVTGPRTNSPPKLPPVGNYDVGWNYIHDNRTNRAINFYSEQDFSAFVEDNAIHDNLIVDQRGDGILIGWYITGDTRVYNNIVVRAGLGPEWVDGISSHAGIRIDAGHDDAESSVSVVHNTIVDSGFVGEEFGLSGALLISAERGPIEVGNNILVGAREPLLAPTSLELAPLDWTNLWFPQAPAWDTAALTEPPAFSDADELDFHLSAESPAIDAAAPSTAPEVTHDHDGRPRPQGPAADLGALEWAG